MTDLEAIFKSHHQKMVIVAKGIVGEVYAEDMVSDAFLKIHENKYECTPELLVTLVITCCLNKLKHIGRAKKHHRMIKYLSADYTSAIETKAELIASIVRDIESLHPQRKKIVKLYLDGYSTKEIASLIGLSENTIRVTKAESIKWLKEKQIPIIKK